MPLTEAAQVPRCTYRVQLHRKFAFDDLIGRLDYLRTLGISHLYLSPLFTATPGSLHGYDVNDYREVNPEIGGRDGFSRLTDRMRTAGLAAILDLVPNHMGIAGSLNPWWRDVLERGRASPYADFFDIQWKAERNEDLPRVLVPVLEDHYGNVLERGKIAATYDGAFAICYGDISLPMSRPSYRSILAPLGADEALTKDDRRALATLLAATAPGDDDLGRMKSALRDLLHARPAIADRLGVRLRVLNGVPGDPGSFVALHALLDEQHYRLARWKTGAHEINYRRFFAIDTLVGLHMERPEVFHASHALLAELIAEGRVGGLRVDHVDGLRQPGDYLQALHRLDAGDAGRPAYVLVEKILAAGEALPASWPVHGTTGYEFIAQLADVLVDGTAAHRLDEIYAQFTGETVRYEEVVEEKKRLIVAELFADAVSNLGLDLTRIIAADWRWRDLTAHELTAVVSELMVNLSVYRTYRRDRSRVSPPDQHVIEAACARAIARNPRADPQPIAFVRDLLIGDYPPANAPDDYQRELLDWVLTFQQYTGAVMAKSVEDTAFYTYCRLIGLNEVGGDPGRVGGTVAAFHETNRLRLERAPHTLIATSTHDSKFSEDVRARLYALSEIVDEWTGWIAEWHALNAPHLTRLGGGTAPDPVDEYRFYQAMLGVWPLDEAEVDETLRARLRQHFRKAVEEAKRHTSILHPNEDYFAAGERFVDALVTPRGAAEGFPASFRRAARRVARLGMINSLTQLVLKCTVPGVPDFYQGNEILNFTLVDPDNRREVDFGRRESLNIALDRRTPSELIEHWTDGALKLFATRTLLQFRAAQPELFSRGHYQPCQPDGAFADSIIAFSRRHEKKTIVVVVPRWTAKLGTPPLGAVWDDTRVAVEAGGRGWRDLFTGREFVAKETFAVRELFAELPFAVLETAGKQSR